MRNSLRKGGILCSQGECQWLNGKVIREVLEFCRPLYPTVAYAFTTIPTYPAGQIGFILCSKEAGKNLKEPLRKWSEEEEAKFCRYYNSEVHSAAFVLPQFTKKLLMS